MCAYRNPLPPVIFIYLFFHLVACSSFIRNHVYCYIYMCVCVFPFFFHSCFLMPCSRQSLLDHITVQLAPRAADEIWYGEGQVRKPSIVYMQMIQNPWRETVVQKKVSSRHQVQVRCSKGPISM